VRDSGVSILLVEHDMDFVMGLTDRLVVMNFGAELAQGRPAEIQRNPAVLEAYLGSAALSASRSCTVEKLCVAYGRVEAGAGRLAHRSAGRESSRSSGPNGAGTTSMLGANHGCAPLARGQPSSTELASPGCAFEERVAAGMSLVPEKRELFVSMCVEDNLDSAASAGAARRTTRARSRTCGRASPASPSAGPSSPGPCPEASGRCSPWRAR
jgi:ABC-type branched-subunit amino acid transport system ATPase component